jgi:predicted RNA-binding Zn ribbon-like protein
MSEKLPPFAFIGGALCLDFVNTVGSHLSSGPREKLCAFPDLIRWSKEAGLIHDDEARQLLTGGEADTARSTKALEDAKKFREILFGIFRALCQQQTAPPDDLAALNEMLRAFPIRLEICSQDQNFHCERTVARTTETSFLAPVVWSAADLLASDQVEHIRLCANPTCGWFFVDNTKNHSRRWCAMDDCGGKAKAKRYYAKRPRRASRIANSPRFANSR